jgi:drug/metabolite transporter (DMT)-like permease
MTSNAVVIGLSLGAALAFAVSTALKHRSAQLVAPMQTASGQALGRFIMATLRHRLWLIGAAADIAGLSLQVLALHLGALALVQPLLLTGLIFALVLRGSGRIRWRELSWAIVVCAALAALLALIVATPSQVSQPADVAPSAVTATIGLAVVGFAYIIGRRSRTKSYGAALLGVSIGTIYAATAALLKALSDLAANGPLAVLQSWQLYAVVLAGATGLLITQLAFQAGPLTASLPTAATVDPVLSVVIGVVVFDERLQLGYGRASAVVVLGSVLVFAVFRLLPSGPRPEAETAPGDLKVLQSL